MVKCDTEENYDDVVNYYIVAITSMTACCIISTSICLIGIWQLCCFRVDSISKTYRLLTILCIVSFVICGDGDLIHVILRLIYFPICGIGIKAEVIPKTIINAIYYFANISFYSLLLARIYNTFNLSKWITFIFCIFIFSFTVESGIYCTIAFVFSWNNDYSAAIHVLKYIGTALSITDFILNLAFFIIFFCQMKYTIIDIDIQSDMYQKITNVLTKHVVLFGIAIITNQAFFLWLFYGSLNPMSYIIFSVIAYSLRSLEVTVNVLVLWLVININYDKYIRFCKCCHLWISKCWMKNIEPLQNPYQQLKDF